MKKFFILALALTFVAGFAYAEDAKYSFSGQYRWEMYDMNALGNLDEDTQDRDYFDQRFRLQMNFMPADGVEAVLRGDYAETTWGTNVDGEFDPATDTGDGVSGIGYRPGPGHDTIMIDKAYVDLTKGMFNIKAGLRGFGGFGNSMSTDYQGSALEVKGNFEPVTVKAMWVKLSEGEGITDEADDDDADKDEDLMGAEVIFAAEAFSVGGFYATKNNQATEDVQNVLGIHGKTSFGKIGIWAEIDLYSGSNDDADIDYTGTNVAVNAEMGVNEQLTVGLDLFYAVGNDDDDKDQISFLLDDWGYVPLDHGPFKWIQTTGINVHEVENDAGSQGLNVYGTFMAMEELAIFANVGYVMPQTEDPDDNDVYVENYTVFAVGASYTFLPGTSFNLKYDNISVSGEEINDDPQTRLMGMLKVNF